MSKIHQVPVLHVRGSNYTVGYSIGRTFKGLIEDFIKNWSFFNDVLLPAYEHNEKGKQIYEGCLEHCRTVFPQYVKELEGMAEGSQVPFHHLFLLHIESLISPVLDDPSTYYDSDKGPPATGLMGCTSIICNGAQPVLGHTEDAAPEMTNSFFIVCVQVTGDDDETVIEEFATLTYPGYLPGYTMGYNAHGIVYSVNTIVPAKTYADRTPVHFICRAFMGKKNFEEIEELLKDEGTGIADGFSLNLFIVKNGQSKAWNIEIGPNQNSEAVSELSAVPVDAGTPSVHCNKYLRLTHPQQEGGGRQSSKWRMEAIGRSEKPEDAESVKRILSDRSNEKFPVFREAPVAQDVAEDHDYASTIATGIFDINEKTWSIYTRPSAESKPVIVLPMKFH